MDATITATAAGDIFTQDMEDVIENEAAASGKIKPKETKQAKYESKPPRQESGTGNDPKAKPSKGDADNFNTEMMAHFKNSDLVEQFLAGVNEYVTDVSKIKSYKQLGFFKGKFRKLKEQETGNQQPLIPEADINDG